MEKRHLKGLSLVATAALVLYGCGGIGKMKKYAETIKYTVEPNPLIVQGDSVAVAINGSFPGKYFYRKAQVELTPTLTYPGGETPYKMVGFQGDKAVGNYTVIPYEAGKSFSYTGKVAFTQAMGNQSELVVKILGKQGTKKEMPFDPFKLADGVITTPYLLLSDDKVIMAKDAFQRVTSHSEMATINSVSYTHLTLPTSDLV